MRHPGELLTLGMLVVAFPITADACSKESRKSFFTMAVLAGAVAAALAGYAAYMTGDSLRLSLPSVENPVPAGEYLGAAAAVALPTLLAELAAPLAGPLAAFALGAIWIALLMTKSRGPLGGGIAGSALGAALSGGRRFGLAIVVVAACAAVLFSIANPEARVAEVGGSRAAASRSSTWRATVALIAERPLTGHGPGSYPDLAVVYRDEVGSIRQLNAHNFLLQTACDTGLLGSGALALFMVLGIRDVVRALRASPPGRPRSASVGSLAGVAALLVSGVFSVSTDAEPGMLLFALLGLGAARAPDTRGEP